MGGGSYDRDVYSGSSYDSWGASSVSTSKLSSSKLDGSMQPKGKVIKSSSKNPLIIVLDVTGSNINFAKLVYDKLPMFYGEIVEHKYLDDFDVCICAIGDSDMGDYYPLQIGTFAKGIEIDSWIEKLVLEGHGGGNMHESYELAAHYLLNNFEYDKDAKPLIFFIGDEMPYAVVSKENAEDMGIPITEVYDPFPEMNKKFKNKVYMMLNKYQGSYFDEDVEKAWRKAMSSEHLIKINEEKAIVDLMLGIIAMEGKKNLKTYALDMGNRGQTQGRISGVTSSLQGLSTTMALQNVEDISADLPMARRLSQNKGTRIG